MISVIIPVLNEVGGIVNLLRHLEDHSTHDFIKEIIVVDGGSTDGSTQAVQEYTPEAQLDIHLIKSEKGRGKQMNTGAKKASGSILYFLHADSYPPLGFDALIGNEIKNGHQAGCFRMKFDSSHTVLKISQWFTRFNYKFCRGGDQSLFITKDAFDALGGYDESYTVYEDCELIGRIYDQYGFRVIGRPLTTSARKYRENGTIRLQYHFAVIHLKKFFGASPRSLSNYYQKNIA